MTTRRPPIRCQRRPAMGLLALLVAALTACSTAAPRQTRTPSLAFISARSASIRARSIWKEGWNGSDSEPISLISWMGAFRSGLSKKKRRPFLGKWRS